MTKPRKAHLYVVEGDKADPPPFDPDIIDTGPGTMRAAAQSMRLIDARAAAHEALECVARETSIAEVIQFLRSEVKRFQEQMPL